MPTTAPPRPDEDQDVKYDPTQDDFNNIIDANYPEGAPSADKPSGGASKNSGDKNFSGGTRGELRNREQADALPEVGQDSDLEDQEGGAGWKTDVQKPSPEQYKKETGIRRFLGKKNRNKVFATAGIGGGIVTLIFGFMSLLPFKIPGIMQMVTDKTGDKLQHVVEKRAERIIFQYLFNRAGGTGNNYVITGSPLYDLYATFRINKVEDSIQQKYGVALEKRNGVVRLIYKGSDLGVVQDFKGFESIMERNGLIDSNKGIKAFVRAEVPAWRFFKRMKMARWLRIKYGIPKFGAAKVDDAKTDEEKIAAFNKERVDTMNAQQMSTFGKFVACFTGDTCPLIKDEEIDAKIKEDMANRSDSSGSKQIEAVAKTAADEAATEVATDATQTMRSKMVQKITALLGSKAIPIVGWADLFFLIAYYQTQAVEQQWVNKIPAAAMGASYAGMFTMNAGYGDQNKAGDMPAIFVNEIAPKFDGVEASQAFNFIDRGTLNGEALSEDEKVNSNKVSSILPYIDRWFSIAVKPLATLWHHTVTKILDTIGDLGMKAILFALKITGSTAVIEAGLEKAFGPDWEGKLTEYIVDGLLQLAGLTVDVNASGAKLFNSLYVGGDVAFNDHCKEEIGCRALSPMASVLLSKQLEEEKRAKFASLPLYERLFSTEQSSSLVNKMAVRVPVIEGASSVQTVATTMFSTIASTPSMVMSLFTANTMADELNDGASIGNVRQYGATDTDLDYDIPVELRQQPSFECPETDPEKEFNKCKADKKVISSTLCVYKIDCPDALPPPVAGPAPGGGGGELPSGNAQQLATQLLALHSAGKIDLGQGRPDVVATSKGAASPACGHPNLHPAMLQILIKTTERYKIKLSNIVSGHECDELEHPKGNAFDVDSINGKNARGDNGGTGAERGINRAFYEYLGSIMPKGSRMGQRQCPFFAGYQFPAGVTPISDICSHLHIDFKDTPR